MTDKLETLKASARGIARLLGDIASFDCWEIDGDIVDIRFEDENGCDTGADVSITETADKASQAIGELLAALEEKDQKINSWRNLAKQNIAEREKDIAALDVARQRNADLQQRLQQPIKLRKCDIGIACEFISEHVVVSLAAVMVEAATAGFKVEVEGE
ncbi:hypothetical protein BFS14_02055 [Serratia fonticola]|uniref:hypothetical protein n=1 Tax=Serratia fonticola TaxID=47917 RepID=UPI0008FD31C5|nr:hypothetical protein [Serratia fonticola]OIX96271.1 hypothetical protein BFS14_02055 [Serratia fonticola]QCR60807.1 hypothetical protein FD644_10715 [Serratia fonticola]